MSGSIEKNRGIIEKVEEEYQSSTDNLMETPRLKDQVKKELYDLQKDIEDTQIKTSFFEKRQDIVVYNIDLVKQYLKSCLGRGHLQLNSTVITAVQIALETQGYDVGVIDGILWKSGSRTRKAVWSFQEKWNDDHKDKKDDKDELLVVDWIPWINTIGKILQVLWGNASGDSTQKPETRTNRSAEKIQWSKRTTEVMKGVKDAIEADAKTTQQDHTKQVKIKDKGITETRIKQQTEAKKTAEIEITNTDIEPVFKQGSDFFLQNREEYINNTDILQWPKLQASNCDQVWWIGSSMMVWFSGYGNTFKNMCWKTWATTRSQQRYWEEVGKSLNEEKLRKYCEDKWIKSFVLYFGWNEATNSVVSVNNAYDDVKLMWECLECFWVQPVLCTCIWEKKLEHSVWRCWKEYPLIEYNQKIRNLWREKNWPVIDYAKIDVGNVWYSKSSNTHPGNAWYIAMGQKIKDNISV